MSSGVYNHSGMSRYHKSNCQCFICKGKRDGRKGKNNPMFGKHRSEETNKKQRQAHLGKKLNHKLNCQCSVCKTKRGETVPWNKGLTKETDERVAKNSSETSLGVIKLWQNPEYREKQLKAIFKGLKLKPNKPEILLNKLLQELFPNQYKYVGDGSILIGYKNPDFININGQKIIIELFGDHWHSKQITKRDRIDEEQFRIKHFAKYGYKTLIVWECELGDIEKLKEKLLNFMRSL